MTPRPAGRGRTRPGFSLLECVIAAFVVTAGFLTVASMYPLSYQAATLGRNRAVAMRIAQNLLEQLRAHPYGRPLDPSLLADAPHVDMVEGKQVAVTFRKEVSFATGGAVGTSSARTDAATVTVSWNEGTAPGGGVSRRLVRLVGGLFGDH